MTQYKFEIGNLIAFRFRERRVSAAAGPYKIVGYQPNGDGEPRYRIKSDLERHERIAREGDIAPLNQNATTVSA